MALKIYSKTKAESNEPLNGDDKRWLRTAHYRSEVFDYLSAHAVDSWSIDWKRHSQNGAIHLIHSGSDLAIRLLREAPTPGGVPCAGSNTRPLNPITRPLSDWIGNISLPRNRS